MQNRNITKRLGVWAIMVAAVLTIPLLIKAPWTGSDYVFSAILLFGSAAVFELTTRNMSNPNHRVIVGFVVVVILLFVWGMAANGFD